MTHVDDKVGERVRIAREQAGFSQRQLAARSEMNGSFISRIEKGERVPSTQTLLTLAEALKVDAHYLAWGRFKRNWAVFDLDNNKAYGPFPSSRHARLHAMAKKIDGEGLVLELRHP